MPTPITRSNVTCVSCDQFEKEKCAFGTTTMKDGSTVACDYHSSAKTKSSIPHAKEEQTDQQGRKTLSSLSPDRGGGLPTAGPAKGQRAPGLKSPSTPKNSGPADPTVEDLKKLPEQEQMRLAVFTIKNVMNELLDRIEQNNDRTALAVVLDWMMPLIQTFPLEDPG